MPVFVTQVEGDNLMLIEAETSGAFAKSETEIRANPMAAFDNALDAIGRIGRVASERLAAGVAGTTIEGVELRFGVKIDQAGSVMLAMENESAQFTVKLSFRT
jgi:NTP-dependent ternary system trypsin peptidase co-occuring protein